MEGKNSFRPLVALARRRLRSALGGRLGALAGALLAVGFGVVVIALRVGDGASASFGGLLATAARWIAWGAGAPVALTAAGDRAAVDRADGIEALAASRGYHRASLESARTAAAMAQASLSIGAPLAALSLASIALAGSISAALRHAALGLGIAAFSIMTGVMIGGVAAASGRAAGPRGRWLLAAIILVPWVLSDLFGYRAWSIPGALDAALGFLVRASGLGGAGL